MNSHDLIFDSVYKGALKAGAKDRQAKDQAVMCLQEFKRRGVGKQGVGKLVEQHIKEAKKLSK